MKNRKHLVDGGVAVEARDTSVSIKARDTSVSETSVSETGVSEVGVSKTRGVGNWGDSRDGLVGGSWGSSNVAGGDWDTAGGVVLGGHWGFNSDGLKGGSSWDSRGVDEWGTIVKSSIPGLVDGVSEVASETGGTHNGVSESDLGNSVVEVTGGGNSQDGGKDNDGLHVDEMSLR